MKKYLNFIFQPLITKEFKDKLKQNFHTLTPFEMLVYFFGFRPFWNKEKRFFFQGSLPLLGQMSITERKLLYETILEYKPRQCFEIGTYTGGGSTFFLASAFSKNKTGELITMENSEHYYNKAKKYYENNLSSLNNYTKFVFGSTPNEFDKYLLDDKKIDCVFFDGAEDAQQTLDQYNYFLPYFKPGSVIMFHDWNTEKTRIIRPIILNNHQWKKIKEIEPPNSVGMVVFIMT